MADLRRREGTITAHPGDRREADLIFSTGEAIQVRDKFTGEPYTEIIELAYLESSGPGPQIQSETRVDIDGLVVSCRHDCGARVTEWRGLFRNNGA